MKKYLNLILCMVLLLIWDILKIPLALRSANERMERIVLRPDHEVLQEIQKSLQQYSEIKPHIPSCGERFEFASSTVEYLIAIMNGSRYRIEIT